MQPVLPMLIIFQNPLINNLLEIDIFAYLGGYFRAGVDFCISHFCPNVKNVIRSRNKIMEKGCPNPASEKMKV